MDSERLKAESPNVNHRRGVSRKTFLIGTFVGLAALILQNSNTPSVRAEEVLSLEDIKRDEIEKKRGIRMPTLGEVIAREPFWKEKNHRYRDSFNTRWTIETLNDTDFILGFLPEHMYSNDSSGKPLWIILSNNYSLMGGIYPEKRHRIELDQRDFLNLSKEARAKRIVHEAIHNITPIEVTGSTNQLVVSSSWHDQIYEIFGGGYLKPPLELVNQVNKHPVVRPSIGVSAKSWLESLDPQQRQVIEFHERFVNGINGYPNELIASSGEYYLYGERDFIELHSRFMDTQIANRLYQFMRREVFGVEYEGFGVKKAA